MSPKIEVVSQAKKIKPTEDGAGGMGLAKRITMTIYHQIANTSSQLLNAYGVSIMFGQETEKFFYRSREESHRRFKLESLDDVVVLIENCQTSRDTNQ